MDVTGKQIDELALDSYAAGVWGGIAALAKRLADAGHNDAVQLIADESRQIVNEQRAMFQAHRAIFRAQEV